MSLYGRRRLALFWLPSCAALCTGPSARWRPLPILQLAPRASRTRLASAHAAAPAPPPATPPGEAVASRAPHPATLPLDELLRDVTFERTRRSGPGGQHRNKVESAVVALHVPSGVRAEASERRSQHENREIAIARLRLRLALEVRSAPLAPPVDTPPGDAPPPGPREPPSALWRARRTNAGKLVVSEKHVDFPALVAEALDSLRGREHDVRAAAEDLGVSTSQLVKLLGAAQPALQRVNEARQRAGMAPLKA